MSDCYSDIFPDSLTGAILAVEGIKDAAAVLNGPTGCKYYHGAISEDQLPRTGSFDPLRYSERFYFGQPRVPTTYLDGDDYVFGAAEKLRHILPIVARKGHKLLTVINSPGAALIGDDLERFISTAELGVPCVAIESAGFSEPLNSGFQKTMITILERLKINKNRRRRRAVNLLGLTIGHRHWRGGVQELRRILALCGIQVAAVLGAGCTVDELKECGDAEANVIVQEEYTDKLVPWFRAETGLETISGNSGAPIGFDATEAWIRQICSALDLNPGAAIADLNESRRRAFCALNRVNSLTGLPKGATFAIKADTSLALPLTKWMHYYLGMIPCAVESLMGLGSLETELQNLLERIECAEVFNRRVTDTEPDVALASGLDIARLENNGIPLTGIELSLPSLGRVEIVQRTVLGSTGALYLLEDILNGLVSQCG